MHVYTDLVTTNFFSVIKKETEIKKDIYYQNVSLFRKKMYVEVVCFAFKHSEVMPYLQPRVGWGVYSGGGY